MISVTFLRSCVWPDIANTFTIGLYSYEPIILHRLSKGQFVTYKARPPWPQPVNSIHQAGQPDAPGVPVGAPDRATAAASVHWPAICRTCRQNTDPA